MKVGDTYNAPKQEFVADEETNVADLIYHSELLGNETAFYPSIDLTPTYITH